MTAPHAELKRLAEAATPGPWDIATGANSHCFDIRIIQDDMGAAYPTLAFADEPDAAFIAAANPLTILSLIEENERMREASLALVAALKRFGFPVSGAARARLSDHGSSEAMAVDHATRGLNQALQSKEAA